MDEPLLTRLRESGQSGDITSTLEYGEAAFALSDGQLGYVDPSGASSVALRDINRIHSDRDGVLRVETPGGTAITASLVGFDPAGVQGFFNEVRVATNSAKSLPQAPQPTPAPSGPWKTGWNSSPGAAPVSQPPLSETPTPEAPSTPVAFEESVRVIPQATPKTPDPQPEPAAPAARPVVISTMPRYTPEPTPRENAKPAPAPREPKASKEAREGARPVPAPTPKSGPAPKAAPAPEERPVRTAPPRAFGNRELASLAESVERLTSTLRLLAVAMGLAAILVGVLHFREADAVTGLWILGSGLVAAFALLVFAQVARLLAGMARQLSGPDQA